MSDLLQVLPDFDVTLFSHLLHSLEKNAITVCDLIACDPTEIARDCPLPLSDVKRLVAATIEALQQSTGVGESKNSTTSDLTGTTSPQSKIGMLRKLDDNWKDSAMIKTLDPALDQALGGGFRTGYITEVAGER